MYILLSPEKSAAGASQLALLLRVFLHLLDTFPRYQRKRFGSLGIFASMGTTGLTCSKPGGNPLHDHRSTEGKECITPRNILGRVVPRHFVVPAQTVFARWQAGRSARLERVGLVLVTLHNPRTGEIAQVRQRMTNSGHLPIQNSNHPRLGSMEDQIVNLEIAVHEGSPVAGLRRLVREESHHVVEMRQFANRLLGIGVGDLRLRLGDGCEGCDLPIEESCVLAEFLEAYRLGDHAVELGQCLNRILPPVVS